ncbi:MAG: LacI family DNA-binding transcriptional regulator [Kangiellaceae bacterium]|nr:LacI family DNA-binding transcriptional regulator [Kangiellaceae bacterium]
MSLGEPNKNKATSFDIAYKAGVSQSTVSRALRNSKLVNFETRNRIKAIAKELNYKVDKNASNLRSQHSTTIALLLFEEPTNDDSHINPFFLAMLGSITRACSAHDYDLLVSFKQLSHDWQADYEDCHKADGIILLGYGDFEDYQEKLQQLEQQHTNFVLWGATDVGRPGVVIGCDNAQGGYDLTRHLISLGRKKIAFLGGISKACPEFRDRYQGSVKAMDIAGLSVNSALQVDALTTEHSGYQAAMDLINSDQSFDAVFCASDLIAVGAIKALRENGFEVPKDVAVVGFDDIPLAEFTRPSLTTAHQDTKRAGEMLVENLLKQIQNEPAESSLLPTRVVIRKSCGSTL